MIRLTQFDANSRFYDEELAQEVAAELVRVGPRVVDSESGVEEGLLQVFAHTFEYQHGAAFVEQLVALCVDPVDLLRDLR